MLGEIGQKIHAGRSRNDQVALDMRLCLREELIGLGRDLRELDPGWLRRQVGVVSQEPILFSGTVAEKSSTCFSLGRQSRMRVTSS